MLILSIKASKIAMLKMVKITPCDLDERALEYVQASVLEL